MMWGNISLWVLALYISLFVWQSLRQRQWLWLWLAVLLWLGSAVFSMRLLPGVLGVAHIGNVYAPHAYVVPASVSLGLLAWRRHAKGGWQMRQGGDYLALLAVLLIGHEDADYFHADLETDLVAEMAQSLSVALGRMMGLAA